MSMRLRNAVVDATTILVGVATIGMAGVVAWDRITAQAAGPVVPQDREVEDWERFAAEGRRIGPADAKVTIVEWGDYECPFCRRLEPAIRGVLSEFPQSVALVYRHFPMPYHDHAYRAARLAECAGEIGRFDEAHGALYRTADLAGFGAGEMAKELDLADGQAVELTDCVSREGLVPSIERDLEAGEEVEGPVLISV